MRKSKFTVKIRKARLKDVPGVTRLALDLLKYHEKLDPYFAPSRPVAAVYSRHMKKAVYSARMRLLVAEAGGKIIGYALGTIISRPPVFSMGKVAAINDVYISDKFRDLGAGKLLVEELYDWFRSKKLRTVELSVFAGNKLGIKVWEKLGFRNIMLRKRKNI